ncbi:MAG: T9SS type A sorting domain-containing protein [Chitinophagales bacterium]
MKRKLHYLFISMFVVLLTSNGLVAQSDCQSEEPPYPEFIGVYPTPQNDTLPDGTIFFSTGLPTACQGEPYTFDLTVVMPDSIFAGDFTPLFNFYAKIDSAILINPTEVGLPEGFDFQTSAANWTVYGGARECVRVTGMSDMIGDYPMVLSIVAYSSSIPFPVPLDFGGYTLSIVSPENECMISSIEEPSLSFSEAYNFPNPFQEETTIYLNSKQNTSLTLSVFDIAGRKIHERSLQAQVGKNEWVIDASLFSLQSGVYLYTLGNGTDIVGGKMLVE